MIINPLQIGPCTLDEAVGLLDTLARAAAEQGVVPTDRDEAAAILEGRAKALGDSRELHSLTAQRRALIRATFEGPQALPSLANPFETIATRYAMEEPEALELPYTGFFSEGVMEAIALYLPRAYYGERFGIYLHASRLVSLASKAGLDLVSGVTPAVGVHELFHAFVEEAIEPKGFALHGKAHGNAYCLWEEAAADRAAADWCLDPVTSAGTTPVARDLLMQALLPTRAQGGAPGYGDWPLVARDYAAVVPRVLSQLRCMAALNHGDWVLAGGDILTSSEDERRAILRGLDQWAGMLARFLKSGERVVPVYVDLVPWGR